ncbi:metalloprotease PmbA [Buchnera aphidicola str. APS (Acyrthosiphon pisum)]|uniref:Metalloprotease PmbA homolog n=1 Tax=Buchnera aphidicola subsp. Acyrthosiphon pisum (strain APS) TaxID=107806 RepID=PMBA_BUCAI|nr:metalloprotease PmbA [Buchnera aphidicola]P57191.1 RecName: Full=Metalloprotease PmbA homolog [Buchnera aphidicola str. APS (Acyrthosiphon pisum)]pir/A84940/ pmbA protein [imported] - Buchnera sp. (strain APS) [Buchnera sp. (in: enterobacteria)]BAB12809.1 pmbA protein [Buchnera aphidicola str. APS (Acyrthosiphon pisum)]
MQLIKEIENEELHLVNTVKNTLKLSKNINASVEVFIKKTIGISVNVRNNVVENVEFNSDGGLFITVYNKFSKGSVSSKDFSIKNIKNMLDIAINISKYSSSDFFSGLPDIKFLCFHSMELDLFHPWEFNIENAIKMSILSEKSAFESDKRIVNSEGSFLNSHTTINVFGNSLGVLEKYKSTRYSNYTCMIAKDKNSMQRDFDYSLSRRIDDLIKPEILGQKTAKRAISRLGSRKIQTMRSPIIFSSEISHMFFSHLASAISGDNVYQKSTFLINDLKMKIFPDWLDIEENPHLKRGLGSKPFDNEGVATEIKYIIKAGILQTWLLNCYNARKLKLDSTGNCGGIHNWLVSNQNISFEELLKKMDQGILVTELMGQGVDIINGNYSRGAVGFWVEKGKISYPINEITISGNLRNMWNNIVSISSDVDRRNNIQCGSVLLSEIQVSGN